jgi:hypothetical protein
MNSHMCLYYFNNMFSINSESFTDRLCLQGMAGHLQVFAFSDWLSVSLPIEYRETTRGLRWLILHAKLPWKMHEVITNTSNSQFVVNDSLTYLQSNTSAV